MINKSQYRIELELRIVDLTDSILELSDKFLSCVTRENWDSVDYYLSQIEDLECEIGVLCLIKECLC